MRNCLRNVFPLVKQNYKKLYKTPVKMMFPVENDVRIECGGAEGDKGTSTWTKILRILIFIFVIILLAWLFNSCSTEPKEEVVEETDDRSKCTVELGEKMKEEIKAWIQREIQNSAKMCAKNSRISPEQMRSIIKEEIKRQQKVQLKPDFASASAGGMIVRASPTWTEGYSYIYFLFIPIRSTAPPPSIILEPTREAGDCWPMEGQKGSLLIRLAARANIVGFTVEHIDPAMSLSGSTPEAPRNFSVYGIEDIQKEWQKHHFGTYCYDNKNEDESQYFRVQNVNRKSFLYIEIVINSNHGNDKYTCLYRFQVHGFIDRAYHCPL